MNPEIEDEFCEYMGVKCGVIGKTEKKTAPELEEYVGSRVGHEVKLIRNGSEKIRNGRVGIAAGGGSVDFAAKELTDV